MIKVTLLREGGVPVGQGLPLELIAGAQVLARSTVGKDGTVEFPYEHTGHASLGVRLDHAAVFRLEAEALQRRAR